MTPLDTIGLIVSLALSKTHYYYRVIGMGKPAGTDILADP